MTDFVARLIEVVICAVVYAFVAMLTLLGTQALADKISDWLANRKAEKLLARVSGQRLSNKFAGSLFFSVCPKKKGENKNDKNRRWKSISSH